MKLSQIESEMVDAMARAFFVTAWASEQEEKKSGRSPGPGGDWFDIAPRTPKYAREFALMFAGKLPSLLVTLNNAAKADALHDEERNEESLTRSEIEARIEILKASYTYRRMAYHEELGHYLAMQGMGHGVSWFDEHAEFAINVPHVEAYL